MLKKTITLWIQASKSFSRGCRFWFSNHPILEARPFMCSDPIYQSSIVQASMYIFQPVILIILSCTTKEVTIAHKSLSNIVNAMLDVLLMLYIWFQFSDLYKMLTYSILVHVLAVKQSIKRIVNLPDNKESGKLQLDRCFHLMCTGLGRFRKILLGSLLGI